MGYRLGKQRLSGDPRHLWVTIARQHHLRQVAQARLRFRIVPRLRHLPYRSNYRPAAHRLVAHMLDGIRRVPMEPDQSCLAQLVTLTWTMRKRTMRRHTVRQNFEHSIAIEYARCRSLGSTRAC